MITSGQYSFEFEKNRPKINFKNAVIKCYIINQGAKKKDNPYLDSMIVYKTTGIYEPFVKRFTGRGGKMDWARTGLDPTKNYCEITDYRLSLNQTKLECDSVLTYTEYYDEPMWGDLTDMAKRYDREIDMIYPNFNSFSKEVVRKNILPEVDYVGGFGLEGAYFKGVGYDKKPAKLVFYQDGKPFVQTEAIAYKINEKGASAVDCRMTMFLNEEDTLSHPGMVMRYHAGEKPYMELMRTDKGLGQAPFKDSYHQLDMYVDQIIGPKEIQT